MTSDVTEDSTHLAGLKQFNLKLTRHANETISGGRDRDRRQFYKNNNHTKVITIAQSHDIYN